jgi:hypothetical protein
MAAAVSPAPGRQPGAAVRSPRDPAAPGPGCPPGPISPAACSPRRHSPVWGRPRRAPANPSARGIRPGYGRPRPSLPGAVNTAGCCQISLRNRIHPGKTARVAGRAFDLPVWHGQVQTHPTFRTPGAAEMASGLAPIARTQPSAVPPEAPRHQTAHPWQTTRCAWSATPVTYHHRSADYQQVSRRVTASEWGTPGALPVRGAKV